MRLLDVFRRPDHVRPKKRKEKPENQARPLPQRIEPPPATSGPVADKSLPNRASEEDAA